MVEIRSTFGALLNFGETRSPPLRPEEEECSVGILKLKPQPNGKILYFLFQFTVQARRGRGTWDETDDVSCYSFDCSYLDLSFHS